MKQKPNLIDISEINKEIDINIFKNTSNRVNIILGLLIIFIVLLFIYFGLRKNNNIDDNDDFLEKRTLKKEDYISPGQSYTEDDDYEIPIMYRDDAYDLALML